MSNPSLQTSNSRPEWESDFFGTINEMPPEPVVGISHILDAMGTLPAFRDGRLWVLQNLRISEGSSVIEAGCGAPAGVRVFEEQQILGAVDARDRFAATRRFVTSAR